MDCDEFEKNLDCFKTRKDVFGNTVKFNYSWSPSGTGFGQGKGFEIYSETDDGDYPTIFECYDNGTLNLGNMTLINYHDQMEIVKFLRQDPEKWFAERKYNIVITRDYDQSCFYTAFMQDGNAYTTNTVTKLSELSSNNFKFTQDQIDDLKTHLPENMKKIIDLAKTEVTDDGD